MDPGRKQMLQQEMNITAVDEILQGQVKSKKKSLVPGGCKAAPLIKGRDWVCVLRLTLGRAGPSRAELLLLGFSSEPDATSDTCSNTNI